jgi:hypothetical protein
MQDTVSFTADHFLASPAEILGVLTHFAETSRRHSVQRRLDRQVVETALSVLLPETAEASLGPAHPSALVACTSAPPRRKTTIAKDAAGVHRRQYCHCGRCKWCLDNARWERVFEEKFADPAYYGPIRVRHNSSLAGGF